MIGAQQILNKIREICEGCYQGAQDQIKIPRNYKNLSQPNNQQSGHKQIPQVIIKQYLTSLDYLEQYILEMRDCKAQYQHLEQSLQKQQLEIRKHIGIQQQLRLYSQSVKLQLQQSEKQKLQLLENSKVTIKALKLKNQKLFQEVTELKKNIDLHQKLIDKQHKVSLQKHQKPSSHIKTKIKDKSLSQSAEHKDSSLHKIIKTEYIERQKHPFVNVNIRKQLKYKNELQNQKKPHKHYKSIYVKDEEPENSQSKKRHKNQEKGRKDKIKSTIQNKQFDLGTYLSKNELKKSPNKNIEKQSAKRQSSKQNEKNHKSSFQQKSEKFSKHQTEQKMRRQQIKQEEPQKSKQKSRSKQSKNKPKSRENVKNKVKEGKKTVQHNRSLFSVSSVEYRSGTRYIS